MTGILQRLIGRANGEVQGGLRPRLPSLFEGGLREAGFSEIHSELPSTPASFERPQLEPSASPRQAPARAEAADPPEPLQSRAPDDPSGDPPIPPRRQETPQNTRPPTRSEPRLAPTPLLPIEPRHFERPTTPVQELAAPTLRPEVEAPPPDRITPYPAPEPLLPPEMPGHLTKAPNTGIAPPAPAATSDPTNAEQDPAQPEITIHIGRLEIRSEAPKAPAPPRRTSQQRSLPGLSGYLRGERS